MAETTRANVLSTLPPLDPPPSANLVLFSTQQWNWLTNALMALRAGQEAQIQVMGALANGMESLMTQADSLNTQVQAVVDGVAGLGTQLSTLATEITIEVQQLVDAIAAQGANSAAIDSAVSRLQSTASALTGLSTQAADLTASLQADNPAPPAP